jgi:hypothetical protein
VIGERIRDKFAASRRRGIFMGGWAPLGYDIRERKLVINEAEAKLVQSIFRRFAREIQPQLLIEQLAKEGARNKNGKPIDKGYIYRLLHNRVYLGEAVHKGASYPGEHQAIIERDLWDQAHALVTAGPPTRTKRPLGRTPALLKGLIFGPTGTAMTPAHTRKGGRLYRYYVSTDTIRAGAHGDSIRRVSAAQIEAVVIAQVKAMVRAPETIVATWRATRKMIPGLTERQVAERLRAFDELWSELFPAEQARIVQLLVDRVDIAHNGANITLNVEGLASTLQDLRAAIDQTKAAA